MAVASGEVDEAALCEQVDLAAVLQLELLDVLADRAARDRERLELRNVDLDVEVAGVREDGTVFHDLEVMLADDVLVARQRQEDVADLGGLIHRHDAEAVKDSLDGLYRIDFRDDDIGAEAARTHGAALAAPAVAGDDDILAGNDDIRRAHDAIPRRLARAVAVVEEILAVRVVGSDHRELKLALIGERAQAMDARRRLLRAADDTREQFTALRVQHVHEVASVVDDEVRLDVERLVDEGVVLLRRAVMPSEDVQTVLDERCGHIVLCRQRVTARDGDLRTGMVEDLRHVGRLGLEVQCDDHLLARERLRDGEFLIDSRHDRHEVLDPVDLIVARRSQLDIANH